MPPDKNSITQTDPVRRQNFVCLLPSQKPSQNCLAPDQGRYVSQMIRMLRSIFLLTLLVQSNWVFAIDPEIRAIIDQHHPEGPGEGTVIAEAEGVLHGEVNSLVVLYQYLSQSMDRNGWQYLLVFEDGQLVAGPMLVGGGRQIFSEIKIEDMVVALSGEGLLPTEPLNNPKRPAQVRYTFMNNTIVAIGN